MRDSGAELILVTPPTYDDTRSKKASFSYNTVLDAYSQWLLSKRADGWLVIDVHGPMKESLADNRKADPQFTFQPDAVHPNEAGHWVMAQQLIRWFGDQHDYANAQQLVGDTEEALKLIRQRKDVRRNAYVGAAGHKRPGVKAGLPLEEAEQEATRLSGAIRSILQEQE